MSKHSTAEEKLHVSRQVRPKHLSHKKRINAGLKIAPPAPPKGTNANNQFR